MTTHNLTPAESDIPDGEASYASPLLLLIAGVVVGTVGAAFALIGGGIAGDDAQMAQTLSVVFAGLATVFGSVSLVLLIAGGVRWGMYGFQGTPGKRADDMTVALLRSVDESLKISETARRIAYRDRDLSLLRRTIEEDIERADYDGALVLVDELSGTYGYREEAEDFRDRIEDARMAEVDRKVTEAITKLDDVLDRKDFELAGQVAARIQRLFPDSPRTQPLRRRVIQLREDYKRNLERTFLDAAQRDDVEKAMEILMELDKYLTEQEAMPLREVAKGVIGKKRDNLGVQFKMAVQQ